MTLLEAIDRRHSVRAYRDRAIEPEVREELDSFVQACNRDGDLHIFIRYDDPEGFDSRLAHYGSFRGVRNYIVLAGKKGGDFEYRCGYYGEKVVLHAQRLGLNTCWVALTYNKKNVKRLLAPDEALCMVIALGYGETQGAARRSKSAAEVAQGDGAKPDWFAKGVEAALKAPTAVNQQKFRFSIEDGQPVARVKGIGTNTRVDLGIVACHFEIASGRPVKAI